MFVSNTSTLILLAKIGALRLFLENAPKVEIPKEVQMEVIVNPELIDAQIIRREITKGNITVCEADKGKLSQALQNFRLDKGEAAAYALFDRRRHLALLTDDRELIKLCKLENIPFICAMAVVVRLHEKKKYSKNEALDRIGRLQTIGRYHKDIVQYYKEKVTNDGNDISKN